MDSSGSSRRRGRTARWSNGRGSPYAGSDASRTNGLRRNMKFKKWLKLQEVGTGTNAVAVFSRPLGIGMVQREPIDMIGFQDEDHHKKKKKHKKYKKKDDLDSE
jgi:hypothetical protein